MKKAILSIAFASFLYGCAKEPSKYHWRNTPWNIKPDSTFILLKREADSTMVYSRIGEKTCIGTEKLDSVRYVFYKNNLWKTLVYLPMPIYDTIIWNPRYVVRINLYDFNLYDSFLMNRI